MNQIATQEDIKQLGTILSVWAHPDDETYMCAGVMAAAIANGQTVACITATMGEAGVQDESRWPAARLAEIRAAELQAALQLIGAIQHHWLGYHDGHCADVDGQEAINRIREYITLYKPQTILTFGPDGLTGHPDHSRVSAWVHFAAMGTDITVYHTVQEQRAYQDYLKAADAKLDIFFNIAEPPLRTYGSCDIGFCLPITFQAQKLAALKAMPSQTEALFAKASPEVIHALTSTECFVKSNLP